MAHERSPLLSLPVELLVEIMLTTKYDSAISMACTNKYLHAVFASSKDLIKLSSLEQHPLITSRTGISMHSAAIRLLAAQQTLGHSITPAAAFAAHISNASRLRETAGFIIKKFERELFLRSIAHKWLTYAEDVIVDALYTLATSCHSGISLAPNFKQALPLYRVCPIYLGWTIVKLISVTVDLFPGLEELLESSGNKREQFPEIILKEKVVHDTIMACYDMSRRFRMIEKAEANTEWIGLKEWITIRSMPRGLSGDFGCDVGSRVDHGLG